MSLWHETEDFVFSNPKCRPAKMNLKGWWCVQIILCMWISAVSQASQWKNVTSVFNIFVVTVWFTGACLKFAFVKPYCHQVCLTLLKTQQIVLVIYNLFLHNATILYSLSVQCQILQLIYLDGLPDIIPCNSILSCII